MDYKVFFITESTSAAIMCVSCKIKYFFPSIMQIKASKMAHNTILSIACYYLLLSSERTERERNVLFNDALNTFYLRLYGIYQAYGKGPLI